MKNTIIIFILLNMILNNPLNHGNYKMNFSEKGIIFNFFQSNPNKIFRYLKGVCKSYKGKNVKLCKLIIINVKKLYKQKKKDSIKKNIIDIDLYCKDNNNKTCKNLNKLKKKAKKIFKEKFQEKNISEILIKNCSKKKKNKICWRFRRVYLSKIRSLIRNPFNYLDHLNNVCDFESQDVLCKIGYFLLLKWVNRVKDKIKF